MFGEIYTAIPFWVLFTRLEKSHITTIKFKNRNKSNNPKERGKNERKSELNHNK
jgi:hypothetical protein